MHSTPRNNWHTKQQPTAQRKALCGFVSAIVLLVGMELKWFDDQRHYTNTVVKEYIFPQYSFVPQQHTKKPARTHRT